MGSLPIDERLRDAVPEPAQQGLVNVIQHSYFVRCQEYDPTIGDDNQLFGLQIYKSILHYSRDFVAEEGSEYGIWEVERGRQFMLRAGEFLLAPYRLPATNPAQLSNVFPYNSNGAGNLAELNLRKERQRSDMFLTDVEADTGMVIAHTGDHKRGLTSVSLREPIGVNDGRISEWGYRKFLYRNDGSSAGGGGGGGGGVSLPPEVPISEPSVEVRSNAESDEGQGE